MQRPQIAFTGASGTGKSTLARWLAEELGVPFNPVGARSVAKAMGFYDPSTGEARPYDVDKASLETYLRVSKGEAGQQAAAALAKYDYRLGQETCRSLFQAEVQRQKIEWEDSHRDTGFVTDRATLDDLAYSVLHNHSIVDDSFLSRALTHASLYTKIFFAPIDAFQHIGNDSARLASRSYHVVYEALLDGLIIAMQAPPEQVVDLCYEGLEDRKNLVRETLDLTTVTFE